MSPTKSRSARLAGPSRQEPNASLIVPLVSRLTAALHSYPPGTVEILFVDDSSDDTPERIHLNSYC